MLTRRHEVKVAAVPKHKHNKLVVEDASRHGGAVVVLSAPLVTEGLRPLHTPLTTSLLPEKCAWLEPRVSCPVMPAGSLSGSSLVMGKSGFEVPLSSGPSEVGGLEQGRFDVMECASLDHQIHQVRLAQC